MNAEEHYREMVDAANAQTARLRGAIDEESRWNRMASRFRLDPRRRLDANVEALTALTEPTDVVVDVGGGAGRLSLPLALRCRQAVNIEPSPGMAEQFEESAAEAGITNARVVQAGWLDEHGTQGDVAIVANVTYFVRDIIPFVEKLNAATRRLVVISVWSVPPPVRNAAAFAAVYGEAQLPCPGHRELLPVLWEMGLLPELRVLPAPFPIRPAKTREELVASWIADASPREPEAARARLMERFDELFVETENGFEARRDPGSRELLITWRPPSA